MSILDQLSSRTGARDTAPNRRVAALCVENPALLGEIVAGLQAQDAALAGDCAEVLTLVAEQVPAHVAPHATALTPLLAHKTTRVRWEAMHALSLVAPLARSVIGPQLTRLAEIMRTDKSVIVRDYAVDAIGGYAGTGGPAARKALPLLRDALAVWDGKHAGHALKGLASAAAVAPGLRAELRSIGERYLADKRGVVRKAARQLARATQAS
jgi:hypothetical protein